MATENIEQSQDDELWLTVKIKGQLYAIDSKYIQSIFQLQEKPTKVPNCSPCISGIIQMRKDIITIIDLRVLLGLESLEHEQEEFSQMLEHRKQDHINWVKELVRAIEAEEEFKLATDPHKCAFGKWYDNYRSNSHAITFQLNKLDEPHKALHKTAVDVFNCKRECDKCTREECLREHLKKATKEYMPRVVELLEETKVVFKDSYRNMCVVILHNGEQKALMVDEVNSVEKLKIISDSSDIYKNGENAMVSHIAQIKDDNDQILLLDIDKLISAI